jgi:hypothetical protein
MKLVDYVVDNGDGQEELYSTKREAISAAKRLAKETGEPIPIYRWHRPSKYDDMEIDEGFRLTIEPPICEAKIEFCKH